MQERAPFDAKSKSVLNAIVVVRNVAVLLDADIAAFFERRTEHINQARKRNEGKFPDQYAFQLTKQEWQDLESQNVISSAHGGRRSAPWAYTEYGFAMLCMNLRGDKADRISRVIIDTFVNYRKGTLEQERTLPGPHGESYRDRMQAALFRQMQALLSLPMPGGSVVSKEMEDLAERTLSRVRALLDSPVRKNEQIVAEIAKLEAETAKLYSEAQRNDAETAKLFMEAYHLRLDATQRLREMAAQLERDDVVDLLAPFDTDEMPKLGITKRDSKN